MDLQRALNSRQAGRLALHVSQLIPPRIGLFVCRGVARWLASQHDLPLTRAIRLNRWVVGGCSFSRQELDRAARENLTEIAFSLYMLFHHLNRPQRLQKRVAFSPEIEDIIEKSKEKKRGVVIAGLHMSNFDLVLQVAGWRGLQAFAVSLPEDTENKEAVEWQHQFRRDSGIEVLPASFTTFKQTILRLRNGETMVTGIDRPVPASKFMPEFFGLPAQLPSHHIHLALEGGVPIIVIAAIRSKDGSYFIRSTPEINLRKFANRDYAIKHNTRYVLEFVEEFIRKNPEQWGVLLPVWPDIQLQIP